jgi:hypothetical protein
MDLLHEDLLFCQLMDVRCDAFFKLSALFAVKQVNREQLPVYLLFITPLILAAQLSAPDRFLPSDLGCSLRSER